MLHLMSLHSAKRRGSSAARRRGHGLCSRHTALGRLSGPRHQTRPESRPQLGAPHCKTSCFRSSAPAWALDCCAAFFVGLQRWEGCEVYLQMHNHQVHTRIGCIGCPLLQAKSARAGPLYGDVMAHEMGFFLPFAFFLPPIAGSARLP